jgi:hypothetical protein
VVLADSFRFQKPTIAKPENVMPHFRMTTTKLTILFTILHFTAFGQTKIEVIRPFWKLPSYTNIKTTEIDSFSLFPSFIQTNAKIVIDSSLTDFINSISFEKGQIIDLDAYFANKTLLDFNPFDTRVIPSYQIFFTLKDSSITCCSYYFEINFDKYGQLIYVGWPRQGYSYKKDFKTIEQALKKAIKTAKSKGFKTNYYQLDFGFDSSINRIYWDFAFLQKSTGDSSNRSQEFKSIRIDPITLEIIDITDMNSQSISCGGRF